MKLIIPFITVLLFSFVLISCKDTGKENINSNQDSINNALKEKEIELKEKELNLKEEEISRIKQEEKIQIKENKIKNVNPNELEGTYRVGSTGCTIWAIRMAYEIKWAKGKGTNLLFFNQRIGSKIIYNETDQASDKYYGRFEFFNDHSRGIFIRNDGKEFNVEKIGR